MTGKKRTGVERNSVNRSDPTQQRTTTYSDTTDTSVDTDRQSVAKTRSTGNKARSGNATQRKPGGVVEGAL